MSSAKPATTAPSGKPKRKKQWTRVGIPPHICVVCGDGAYGYNFGQITCESCKAFFRRHINKPRNYVCPGDRQCNVSCKTRKYCPACRLRKCFDVGLKPDIARITNQIREEKRAARKTKTSTKKSPSTSECDSEIRTRNASVRSAKKTRGQSSSDETVKPKSELATPSMRTRRSTCAAQDTPQAGTPNGTAQQDGSESPRLDTSSISPPLVTSPAATAACDTPLSTQCWSVSIPSCASMNFLQSVEAQSPDGQDEKSNVVADEADSPYRSQSSGVRTSPCSALPRAADISVNCDNRPFKLVAPSPNAADNAMVIPPQWYLSPQLGNSAVAQPKYSLDDEEFVRLRSVCNKLVMTMQSPYTTSEISFLGSKMLPESMAELLAIAETSMRRFVRFTKQFEDFRDNFSFDEKVSMLRRAVLTCHIFSFSFGFDVEKRARIIPVADGTERVLSGAHIAELKRRAGLPEHNDPRPAYIMVHDDIRRRFPRTWRMLVAAFSLVALFTPKFQLRKSANPSSWPNSQNGSANADLSCLNLENKSSNDKPVRQSASEGEECQMLDEESLQLVAKIRPFYRRYKAFVPRYVEYAERVCLSEDEKRELVRTCKVFIDRAHAIATSITSRVGLMATSDPNALSLIPLYNELLDS